MTLFTSLAFRNKPGSRIGVLHGIGVQGWYWMGTGVALGF